MIIALTFGDSKLVFSESKGDVNPCSSSFDTSKAVFSELEVTVSVIMLPSLFS